MFNGLSAIKLVGISPLLQKFSKIYRVCKCPDYLTFGVQAFEDAGSLTALFAERQLIAETEVQHTIPSESPLYY